MSFFSLLPIKVQYNTSATKDITANTSKTLLYCIATKSLKSPVKFFPKYLVSINIATYVIPIEVAIFKQKL